MQLPTIPPNQIVEYKKKIAYTDISVAALTASSLIVGLPFQYVVCGTKVQVLTSFSGPSLSSLTVSLAAFVPSTILSDLYFYGLSTELTQTVTPQSFQVSGPPNNNLTLGASQTFAPATGVYFNGAHDVAAYFTATGTNLNNLSAGLLEVTVQIRPF